MNRYSPVFALVMLLVSGCAHLEQAPLVYSSKTSVGIDVSTTSVETPGLSMSVGYKQIDAAYVPVAVARACPSESKNGADCSGKNYELQLIAGHSKAGDSTSNGESVDAAAKAKAFANAANSYAAANEAANRQQDSVASLEKQISQLTGEIEAIDEKRASYAARRQAELATPSAVLTEIQALDADEKTNRDNKTTELIKAEQNLITAKTKLAAERADAQEKHILLTQTKDAINQVDRDDSYSVFGSFEGKTKANAKAGEASVGLGKIFATGVASQNISAGLSNYYETRGVTACYEAVSKLATASINAADLGALLQGCRFGIKDNR